MSDTDSPRIKFFFDTHIGKSVTTQLRLRGVDVLRCEDVSLSESDDMDLLDYAAREGRTIITADKGFNRWHQMWLDAGKTHAEIFVITHDKDDIGTIVESLTFWHEAIAGGAAVLEEDVYNQIRYIS